MEASALSVVIAFIDRLSRATITRPVRDVERAEWASYEHVTSKVRVSVWALRPDGSLRLAIEMPLAFCAPNSGTHMLEMTLDLGHVSDILADIVRAFADDRPFIKPIESSNGNITYLCFRR